MRRSVYQRFPKALFISDCALSFCCFESFRDFFSFVTQETASNKAVKSEITNLIFILPPLIAVNGYRLAVCLFAESVVHLFLGVPVFELGVVELFLIDFIRQRTVRLFNGNQHP